MCAPKGMGFEPFWSEIGHVLCTLAWNLVWLLDETIFSIIFLSNALTIRHGISHISLRKSGFQLSLERKHAFTLNLLYFAL